MILSDSQLLELRRRLKLTTVPNWKTIPGLENQILTLKALLYDSFVRKKYKKYEKTEKIIGCSLDFLCNYLRETYYKNYGVEYDGTQNVHIDHIVPLSTAKTEKDVYRLCHYTNLQLLNAKDNLRKSDKLDFVL